MSPSVRFAAFRGLPRVFWFLWVGQLINRVGGFVVPFLTLYLTQELKLPLRQAAVIISLNGAGQLLAGPVGGLLADKLGRKVTLVGASTASALCMMALGYARDPALIGLLALLLGFTTDTYRPAMFAIVADLLKPEDRLRAYAHLYWASNLGFSVAPVIAGALANHGYLILFAGDAATTLAFALLTAIKVPETLDKVSRDAPPSRPGLADILLAFKHRVFVTFLLASFPLALVFLQFQLSLPATMSARDLGPADFGTTMAVNGILIVILQPFVVPLLPRFRRSRVLALAALLVGVGFGLNAFCVTVWHFRGAVIIWTLGEIIFAPTTSSLVADLAPADARGRFQGAYFTIWAMAGFIGPLFGGWGQEALGRSFWLLCFALTALIALAHLAIAGARERWLAAARGRPLAEVRD